MPGMKVTLSAAMRARDVSRPTAEDQEAAEQTAARASLPSPAGPGARARAQRSTDDAARTRAPERTDAGTRSPDEADGVPAAARPREDSGRRSRSRRKRR